MFVGCDSIEGCFLSMCDYFILLAVGTSFYVIGYPLAHSYPVMRPLCLFDCFISSGVSGHGVIVYERH